MYNHQGRAGASERAAQTRRDRGAAEFPVREYGGAMAAELAQMARWDGDERLGCLLDAAVEAATRKPEKLVRQQRPSRRVTERRGPPG